MTGAAALKIVHVEAEGDSVEADIEAFLDGDTNGESLLHALYDGVLDEEIPAAMKAILRSA